MKIQVLCPLCGVVAIFALFAARAEASALLKPSSGATQALAAKSLAIDARIDGAFARTTLTTIYKNPNSQRIEADFIYSAPQGSVVTGFAYWFGAEKVVARVVEKKRAARIYSYITTRQRDPALIEMIGKNAFRARIFPVEASQDLKIEVQLAQKLEATREGFRWTYPLREETQAPLEKLKIHLQSSDAKISANLGPFAAGELDVERENVRDLENLRVLVPRNPVPLRASLLARREGENGDGFFALSLASSSPVTLPRLKISGISTYDVLAPAVRALKAGEPFVVFGRYRKGGKAIVALNHQSVALDFGDQVETRSVAASFWAQKRIEGLSESAKNQFEVVKLSSRFGLVSKWTSWLAIPAAERARFQQEVDEADRANAGRAYAQATARGDRKTAALQQAIFARLSKKLGQSEPVANFLDAELEIVTRSIERAAGNRRERANVANWRKLQRVLVRSGAKRSRDDFAVSERAHQEASRLAPFYVAAVENNNLPVARRLKSRLTALANLRAVKRYQDEDSFKIYVVARSRERAPQLAHMLALERVEKRLTATRERDLTERIRRVLALDNRGDLRWQLENGQFRIVEEKTSLARRKAKEAIAAGTPVADARRETDALWGEWEKRVGMRNSYHRIVDNELSDAAEMRLASEVQAGRELDPANLQLDRDLKQLEKKTNQSASIYVRNAYQERAGKVAKQLLNEQIENGSQSPRAQILQAELARLAARSGYEGSQTRWAAREIRDEAKKQIADAVAQRQEEHSPEARQAQRKLDKLKSLNPDYTQWDRRDYDGSSQGDYDLDKTWRGRAHETAYRLLETRQKTPSDAAKIAQLQEALKAEAAQTGTQPEAFTEWEKGRLARNEPLLTAQDYRVRWGDPLISVVAPADCQQVIAIMPDGTLLPLSFDAHKKAWEARFDVPMWVAEGDYRVQIVIVNHLGARQRLTMNFALDVSAPKGHAALQNEGKFWKLQLQSDELSDRVSAFTPWKERVELRRDAAGVFAAQVAVPAAWQGQKARVRFILTDKAHNRTEIFVDMN